MKKIETKYVVIPAIVFIFVLMITGVFLVNKFINHESDQSERILVLERQIDLIEEKLEQEQHPADGIFAGGYSYLAIGNSITKHPLADYWWNECGMAATTAENDYYHIVLNQLKEKKGNVSSYAFNFAIWETLYTDRAETIDVLDYYLDESLDLVTIQLGENVQNLDTFESDFEYLIKHIQEISPSAEIIVIGDFWERENRDAIKKKVSEECNVKYVSLDEIKDDKEHQCGMGTEVYDEDGKAHIVEHCGVAAHPNDKAMRYIADKIIESMSN